MAHKEGERIHPCGRCEKCRRIVSMLMALDADPTKCGYKSRQIEDCLKKFTAKGVSQEEAGVRHLGYMLQQKGLINVSGKQQKWFTAHPEVLKLRIDPNASTVTAVPEDLRGRLCRIFLEYSDGVLHRAGQRWIEVDCC